MLSEKCFVVFYVFSFSFCVYVETSNLITSIPGPSILTFHLTIQIYLFHSIFFGTVFASDIRTYSKGKLHFAF